MTDDLVDLKEHAHRVAGSFLVIIAALFAVGAPLFAFTYTQPDMGLLVIIDVVPVLWVVGLVFACLGIGFAATRWQRVAAIVIASALGAEVLALALWIAVPLLMP